MKELEELFDQIREKFKENSYVKGFEQGALEAYLEIIRYNAEEIKKELHEKGVAKYEGRLQGISEAASTLEKYPSVKKWSEGIK